MHFPGSPLSIRTIELKGFRSPIFSSWYSRASRFLLSHHRLFLQNISNLLLTNVRRVMPFTRRSIYLAGCCRHPFFVCLTLRFVLKSHFPSPYFYKAFDKRAIIIRAELWRFEGFGSENTRSKPSSLLQFLLATLYFLPHVLRLHTAD